MSALRLYRGDSTKIDEFKFKKTDIHCLFGPGIYLTDSFDVAQTYRTKGLNDIHDGGWELWFLGESSKEEIYLKICGMLTDRSLRKDPDENKFLKVLDPNKTLVGQKPGFAFHFVLTAIERGIIKLVSIGEWIADKGTHQIKKGNLNGVYVNFGQPNVGKLSVFDFDLIDFESSMVVAHQLSRGERLILDKYGALFLNDSGCNGGLYFKGTEQMTRFDKNKLISRLIESFTSLGYRGIEYPGGLISGGSRHRAFVVWDEHYVNQHRVVRRS